MKKVMISDAVTSINVFRARFLKREEDWKNFLKIDTRRKPIARLTRSTFTSRTKMARIVLAPGSMYFDDTESVTILR